MTQSLTVLGLIAFTFLVYFKTLKNGLVIDDLAWSKHQEEFQKQTHHSLITKWKYRLYGCHTFGPNNILDNIFRTGLYASAAALIYLAFGMSQVSLAAALLYIVNPANDQVSLWKNGRRYMINVILVLLMVLVGPWGLLLYPLTAFFQVSAVAAPLIYGWAGLAALPVFYLIAGKEIRNKVKDRLKIIHSPDMTEIKPKKIIPIVKTYGAYILKMIFPGRTMMIYPFLFYWGMTKDGNKNAYALNGQFFIGLAALGLSGLSLAYFKGPAFWWALFTIVATMQWSGIFTVVYNFTDRYIALPTAFVMYFICQVAFDFLGANAIPILVGLGAYYLTNLFVTFKMFYNIWTFYDYHLYWDPEGPKCREWKATRLLDQHKDPMGAWDVIKYGLVYNPNDMKMNAMAARLMDILDDKPAVINYLKIANKNCYIGVKKI